MPTLSPFIHQGPRTPTRVLWVILCALLPILLFSLRYQSSALLRIIGYAAFGIAIDTALRRTWKPQSLSGGLSAILLTAGLPHNMPCGPILLAILLALAIAKHSPLTRWVRFNVAMTGRLFLMLFFSSDTVHFGRGVDAITTATPLELFATEGHALSLAHLLFGPISGTWEELYTLVPGSPGETSPLLILLLGTLLCARRIADWRAPTAFLSAFTISNLCFHQPLFFNLFTGAICFSAAFIVTDPLSTPLTPTGKWIAGALIGFLTVLWRRYTYYTETLAFAVLATNLLTPLLDQAAFYLRSTLKMRPSSSKVPPTQPNAEGAAE